MKKLLTALIIILFTSCSKEEVNTQTSGELVVYAGGKTYSYKLDYSKKQSVYFSQSMGFYVLHGIDDIKKVNFLLQGMEQNSTNNMTGMVQNAVTTSIPEMLFYDDAVNLTFTRHDIYVSGSFKGKTISGYFKNVLTNL